MKPLIRIIILAIIVAVHFHAYSQEGVCDNKINEIKETSLNKVTEHIALMGINENEKQEIKDLSDILYNYVEEFYYIKISTIRTIKSDTDKESLRVSDERTEEELNYIYRIDKINKLIPDIQFLFY